MYQTRGASWIGFEEAQKAINALKEEIEQAEKKLSKADHTVKFDRAEANSRISRQTSSASVMRNIYNKNEHTKPFFKQVVPKPQLHDNKPHKKRGKLTAPKVTRFSSYSEDQSHFVPSKISPSLPTRIEISKITTSDSSNSYNNLKYDSSSSEKTSSLIADTYANIDSKLTSIIERNEKRRYDDAPKITFTHWEEEFLKSYADMSDVEVMSSQSDKPLENITNGMEWTPVFNNNKLLRTKKTADDGLLTLKQIIERQKRLHEEISKSERSHSPSENIDYSLKLDPNSKAFHLEDITYTDIEAEAQVRPPPVRKVRLVTALPRYRGFSTPCSFPTGNSQSKFKFSKKPPQSNTVTECPVKKNKESTKEDYENIPNQIEKDTDSNHIALSHETLPVAAKNDIEKIPDSKLPDEILVDIDKENSLNDYSTDTNIKSNIESQDTFVDKSEKKSEEQYNVPKFFPCKSVKRKAFKVHAEEKMAPSPKIRHYDTKAVRDYIKKKKAERRKRHLEEHKKSLEEVEKKKESLQKLLEFQKQCLNVPNTKALSPSKASQRKVEIKSKDSELHLSSLEFNLLHKDKIEIVQLDATKKSQLSSNKKLMDHLPSTSSQKGVNGNENVENCQQTSISEMSQMKNDKEVQTNVVNVEPLISGKIHSKANYVNAEPNPLTSDRMHSETNYVNDKNPAIKLHEVSFTSCEYQSTNLSDYISSINTTPELSQLPSLDDFFPHNLENERSKLPKGKQLPAEALKNLVKSIDERTAPYEHLVRTKAWVDQSPPPPNRKSAKQVPHQNYSPHKSTKEKIAIDFAIDVAKSLNSFEKSSFIEQVKDIGDTSDLFTQLLGNPPDNKKNTSYREITIVGAAKASSHTFIDSDHGYHLIEGSLESDSSVQIENNVNSKITSHENGEVLTYVDPAISEFATPKIVPDPFNFINTWKRKPLGVLLSPKDSVVMLTKHNVTDRGSDDANNTLDDTKSSLLTSPMHSSLASESIKSLQESMKQSTSSSKQSETHKENKSLSGYSSHTLTPSSYTSIITGSSTSQTLNSRSSPEDGINDQPESNPHETDIKEKSPSESSISEIVSVIVNFKNVEQASMDLPEQNSSSSKIGIVEKQKLSDVPEMASDESKSSSRKEILKSPEESIQEDMERSFHGDDIQKQDVHNSGKSSPATAISETKSHNIPSEEKESSEENVSEVSLPSKKDVTIDFTQPVRLTLSDGVPKSLKILKDSVINEEQYLSTQVVTRVASEAAAAAASSAVIAVFETQKKLLSKEHEETRLLFPMPTKTKLFQKARSDSSVSPKTSPNSGSPNYEQDQFEQLSDYSIEEKLEEKATSSVSTVKGDLNSSNEGDNLYEHASVSTKTSTSNVTEELSVVEKSKNRKQNSTKRAFRNVSSPSPASLSENDSISSIAMASSISVPSSSAVNESFLSDDSFARLTEDVVRKMSYEEKRRATHQLAVLRFEERTLVENARAQMTLLESIKKNLRDKGANAKASRIKKRQKELISRLRHERAQLRCMQEAYRSMCEMNHTMLTDDKKLWHGQDILAYQSKKIKEKSHSSKASSEHKIEIFRIPSASSSTSAILTEEDAKEEEEIHEVDIQMSKSMTSNSQDSIIETNASEKTKSTVSSHSQTPKISPTSFSQTKQVISQPSPSFHSNESALQGLKKLEASKRHLTKREQRILQRRKQVEKLLQWQKKLDSEEMAVRELEQKAIELVDTSKKKTRYYLSPSATSNVLEDGKIPEKFKVSDIGDGSILLDQTLDVHPNTKSTFSELMQSSSTPEENMATAVSGDSIDEILSRKTNSEMESSSALSASSVAEIEKSASSSIKTAENTGESSCVDEAMTNETSSILKSNSKKDVASDAYSELFESAPSQITLSPVSNSPIIKISTPSPTNKNGRNFSIKSPIAPLSFRRHDSSGSDDSYTISHSETASDQSDIEVRIHALSEELRRRRYEADKLKREQKRKYREHLKGTELSLQKQVEAYNQYIQQVKAELEQIESGPSQSQVVDISSVKPQIKWPRPEQVIDSRCIRKKSLTSDTVLLEQKRSIDQVSNSPEYSERPFEYHKKQGKLTKTLHPGTKQNTSPDKFPKPDILEKDDQKVTDTNESLSTEKIYLNKISESKSETSNKFSFLTKDETEVEESYESNSSIGTAEIISEKSSISIKEINSKSIPQSDSYVSSSSTVSQSIKTLGEGNVQEKADSTNENETAEIVSKFTTESQDSEHSSESGKITSNESSQSSGEYTSGSFVSTVTNTESVKDFESGTLEEAENSDGTLSISSRKSVDSTPGKHQNDFSDNSTSKPQLSSNMKENSVPNKTKHILKSLKSETVIVNLVTYLSSSMLDDAIRTVINIANNYSKSVPLNDINKVIQKNNYDMSNLSLVHKFTEKSIEIIIDDILKLYLKDAFKSVIHIVNDLKIYNESPEMDRNHSLNNQTSEPATNIFPVESTQSTISINDETPEVQTDSDATSIQEKTDNSIFKKQTDGLDDGFDAMPWDTQQLEQQMLLQQYPYLYRKIPNKPPPPYTPPAATLSQPSLPLPIKREKPIEKVDPIKQVIRNIGLVVECVVDSLLDGKRNGLMVSEITQPDFSSVVEQLELRNPCQLTFLDLVFDLSKDIALEIYREKDESRAPWVRLRKLSPKPKFPTDKSKVVSTLLKEVEKALKLLPTESYAEQMRKKPTWATMKLGRKKRDFVDTILISEIKREEPDWVNYDEEEIAVKKQIADSVFDYLVDDTISLIRTLEEKFHR